MTIRGFSVAAMYSSAESLLDRGVPWLDVAEKTDEEVDREDAELEARWRRKKPMLKRCLLALSFRFPNVVG